jgi:hypothetical protein
MKLPLTIATIVLLVCSPGFTQQENKSRDVSNVLPLGEDSQIKGFRVPNYDDNSVMTSQIFGESARVLPDGNVEITDLKMEFYSYKGEERITDMTVTSPICYFNREHGIAISDNDVRISRDDMVVTGKGFMFNNQKQELRILSQSKVVLKGAQKSGKLKGFSR